MQKESITPSDILIDFNKDKLISNENNINSIEKDKNALVKPILEKNNDGNSDNKNDMLEKIDTTDEVKISQDIINKNNLINN